MEVNFDKYCQRCKYWNVDPDDVDNPCYYCTRKSMREDSDIPVNFVERRRWKNTKSAREV